MMNESDSEGGFWERVYASFGMRINGVYDKLTIYPYSRWIVFFILFAFYVLRVTVWVGGFYIVSYALGIYILSLFIGFLTPQVDPADLGEALPTNHDDEYRPFQRRLGEYKFWVAATRVLVLSITATFFKALDLPVVWPILLFYFLVLLCLTMRQQIKKMIKYKYVPFDMGKQVYAGKSNKAANVDHKPLYSPNNIPLDGTPYAPRGYIKNNSSKKINNNFLGTG